jgi:hypothetical protein
MKLNRKVVAGLGVVVLAVPAGALAGSGGDGKEKPRNYNAKGVYAGDGVVSVSKGNSAVRKAGWYGQDIAFDFSQADLRVEDTNGDEQETLEDVVVGAPVRVKARLPKGDPGVGPYVADRLDDKSEESDDSEVTDD